MREIEKNLEEDFWDTIRQCKSFKYTPHRFIRLLHEAGPIQTAIQLITEDQYSDGLMTLVENDRLDLTIEAIIYDNSQYHDIVGTETVKKAESKLRQLGYFR